MNRSGKVIPHLFRQFGKPMQFLVAVDNMDLNPGTMRMKKRGGTAGHNGLRSVVHYLDKGFWPLYMGIGRPEKDGSVIEHVLGTAEESEMERYRRITRDLPEILFTLFTSPVEQTIERINTYSISEISAGA
jgi:PTH1 family peptidyl-tRNA hydrolase